MIKKLINWIKMEWEVYQLMDSVDFLNMSKRGQDKLIKQVKDKYKNYK
jgi:hypothetical protein